MNCFLHRTGRLRKTVAALISLIFLAAPAAAQLLPDSLGSESSAAAPPDLAALKTGWWDYFLASQPDAADRHADYIARIREGLSQLSPRQREEAERLVDLVQNNLAAYLELENRPELAPQPLPPSSDEYSFPQLLMVMEAAGTAVRLVADDELEVGRATRRRDSDSRRRDQAFKAYIDEQDSDARWLKGLELLQARSQLLLAESRLNLVKADLDNAQRYRREIEERLNYARERLVIPAGESNIEAAENKLATASEQLLEARSALDRAQQKAAGFELSTDEGKAEQRVQQQRVLRAEALYAQAQIAEMQAEAELWLVRMFSDSRPGLAKLKEQELKWDETNAEISAERINWQNSLEAEILLVQGSPKTDSNARIQKLLDTRLEIAAGTLTLLGELEEAQQKFRFTADVLDNVAATRVSRLKRWLGVGYAGLLAVWQWFDGIGDESLFVLGDTPITGNAIFTVFVWLLLAVLLSRLVRKGLQRFADAGGMSSSAGLYTFGRLFHYVIIVVALVAGLSAIGVDFGSLALIAGALGVGIGFGLQTIVNNFVSGLVIMFEGSLRVGDYIELDTGVTGTVKAIDARSTLINTNDNIDIIVPNGEIASNKLTNWTLAEYILRMRIPFGVEYGTDKELVKQAAIEAANNVHFTLKNVKGREPDVWLVEFGDSSLNFLLLVWVNRQGARRPTRTRAAYLWALDDAFQKHGITVPFPQRDLHLKSDIRTLQQPDLPRD